MVEQAPGLRHERPRLSGIAHAGHGSGFGTGQQAEDPIRRPAFRRALGSVDKVPRLARVSLLVGLDAHRVVGLRGKHAVAGEARGQERLIEVVARFAFHSGVVCEPGRATGEFAGRAEQLCLGGGDILSGTDLAICRFKLRRRLGKQHIPTEAEVLFDELACRPVEVVGLCTTEPALPHFAGR